jgi:HSP20 family protein
MSLIRYNPYGLTALQRQINRIFEDFDSDFAGRSEELGGGMFSPAMDVKEDTDAYTVQLEVPGVPRDKIEITLQENNLVIRGTREQAKEEHTGQFRRVERSYGSFSRSLSLPRNVDAGGVSANLEDGVLTVRLPKSVEARPRQISIDGGNGEGSLLEGTAVHNTQIEAKAPTGE